MNGENKKIKRLREFYVRGHRSDAIYNKYKDAISKAKKILARSREFRDYPVYMHEATLVVSKSGQMYLISFELSSLDLISYMSERIYIIPTWIASASKIDRKEAKDMFWEEVYEVF